MSRYINIVKLQERLAPQIITKDRFKRMQTVCGVDVSYKGQDAYSAAILMDSKTLEVIKMVRKKVKVTVPYVPGLMMMRESKPALSAISSLKQDFDLLLVDGNGILHPRMCGLASYLGIVLDKPTIGVAKSLLCGMASGNSVKLDGRVVGRIIEKAGKKIYVITGHKISSRTAVKLTESFIKDVQWLPEPLRVADMASKGKIAFPKKN